MKYTLLGNYPTHVFIILDCMPTNIFINKSHQIKNLFCYLDKRFILILSLIFKLEVMYRQSFLTELSLVEPINLNRSLPFPPFFKKNLMGIYIFFFFLFSCTVTLLTSISEISAKVYSIDTIYNNAGWLEREASEMYGIFFTAKNDTRKLLLDYSKLDNPMLKNFPTEGFSDVFYNFFDNQIAYVTNDVVEL